MLDIAVITALHPERADFLYDAYESLVKQAGIDWVWIIQIDGEGAAVPEAIASDPRVRIQTNGSWLGAGATRNRAMLLVTTELVATLDADDVYVPQGLSLLATTLHAHPSAEFAWGGAIDFFPNGHSELAANPSPYQLGDVARGTIEDHWLRTGLDGLFFSAMAWRTHAIFQVGGWAALSGMEDTALVLAASHAFAGYRIGETVQRYRVHAQQTTLSRDYARRRAENRRWLWECVNARRAARGRPPEPMPPDPLGGPEQRRANRMSGQIDTVG